MTPKPKKYPTRDEILAIDDRKIEEVDCPEWGGVIRIRGLTCAAYENAIDIPDEKRRWKALLAASIVDETGAPMFAVKDIELLEGRSMLAMQRILKHINVLNAQDQKTTSEIEGNSAPSPSDGSHLN